MKNALPIACLMLLVAVPIFCVVYYNWRLKHPAAGRWRLLPRTPLGWVVLIAFVVFGAYRIYAEFTDDTSLPDSMYDY